MNIRVRMLLPFLAFALLFSAASHSSSSGIDGADTSFCQPRASERHRQGQLSGCATDSGREAERTNATKCQPRASKRHRQGQSCYVKID